MGVAEGVCLGVVGVGVEGVVYDRTRGTRTAGRGAARAATIALIMLVEEAAFIYTVSMSSKGDGGRKLNASDREQNKF